MSVMQVGIMKMRVKYRAVFVKVAVGRLFNFSVSLRRFVLISNFMFVLMMHVVVRMQMVVTDIIMLVFVVVALGKVAVNAAGH